MKKFLIFILIISLIVFVFWGIPMLKCEYLTARYGHEFDLSQVPEENSMLGKVEWFKILSYNDDIAQIYYIDEDFSTGNILTFKKVSGEWKYDSWDTLWTARGGNADENVWPYFWHSSKYR
ncbi:MAG: hypothetical protein E7410_02125 [Ruminococcaceae bacterium]|nr:hypothetical protein [Oscillospiraceae bacterium]